MKLTNDWGHSEQRGWWYSIRLDGQEFAHAENIDTEPEMRRLRERDLRAAEARVRIYEASREVEENAPRVLLVVASQADVARDIGDFAARRMGLEGKVSPCPAVAFAPLPEGVRFDHVCFVGLDFGSVSLALWARDNFGHVPKDRCGDIGCYGAAPGVDLLGSA